MRIARRIRVHGRDQHRVHEHDLVLVGKSIRDGLLLNLFFIDFMVQCREHFVPGHPNVVGRRLRVETTRQWYDGDHQDALR
jgi:hypothetical protein